MMDKEKTKEQLIAELEVMHKRVAELENTLEVKHKRETKEQDKLLDELGERVKELQCMYDITESIRSRNKLEEIFKDVLEFIPSGWHYPEITRGKIIFGGEEYVSEPFAETKWKQSSELIIDNHSIGSVEVYYLKETPKLDEGPFLKEERNLIDSIAKNLSESIELKQMEATLKESELRYRTVADFTFNWEYWEAPDKSLVYVSPACEKLSGYSVEEFINNNNLLDAIILDDDKNIWMKHHQESIHENKGEREVEFRIKRKDGKIVWIGHSCRLVVDDKGTFLGYRATNHDIGHQKNFEEELKSKTRQNEEKIERLNKLNKRIEEEQTATLNLMEDLSSEVTERKKSENEQRKSEVKLRASEEKHRALYENAPLSYQSLDEEGRFLDVNPAWLRTLGYNREEVIGNYFGDFLHTDWKPHFDENFPAFKKRGYVSDVHFKIKHKDGNYIDITFEGCIGYYPDGRVKQTYCVFQDVTQSIIAEEALRKSEERFSRLSEVTYEGILIHEKGIVLDFNLAFSQMFGYEENELLGENVIKLLALEKYWPVIEDRMQRDVVLPYEIICIRKDGTTLPIEIESRNMIDKNGKLIRATAVRDITLRKQNELEIQKLLNAVEQSHSSIVITDTDGTIEYVNKKFTEVSGYSKEEAIGKNPRLLKTDHFDSSIYENLWATISNGEVWTGEFLNKKKNGELFWESAVVSPVKDKNGKIINYVAIKEDITEYKKTEDEKLHLEKIVKSSVNEIYIFDKKTLKFSFLNDSALKNIGYTLEEMKLMTPVDIKPEITLKRFNGVISPLLKGQTKSVQFETIHQRKDKSLYPVDISIQLVEHGDDENFTAIIIDISKRKIAEEEILKYQTDLEEKIEERTEEISVINEMLKAEILKKDKAEKRVSEALVKEKELNQLKDQFMSTVSHDLRTPLTAIQSSVELLDRFYDKWDKEKVIYKYGQIKSSVSRITDMLSHVLELSRLERGKINIKFERVNLKNELQTIVDEIDLLKSEKHQLIYNYKLENENHKVDINLLREILTNLLTNGVKYSPKGGRVELLVEREDEWLILQVSDEGMGISENEIDKIFKDFYRTDGSQNISGSGLGLSIVKHYVEMYRGEIEVESELGKGSVFKIKIPLSD